MLTHEDVLQLTAPFAAHEHDFLQGRTYLTELAITSRMDFIDPAWEFNVTRVEYNGERVTVFATLTVCGTSRSSCGTDKLKGGVGEPEKSATTDALKRCARLFGIGRYILGIPDNVKDVRAMENWLRTNYGAPDGEQASASKPAPTAPIIPIDEHNFGHRAPDTRKPKAAAVPKETLKGVELAAYVTVKVGKDGKPFYQFESSDSQVTAYSFQRAPFRNQGWAVDGWLPNEDGTPAEHDLDRFPLVDLEKAADGYWHVTHATAYQLCDLFEEGATA